MKARYLPPQTHTLFVCFVLLFIGLSLHLIGDDLDQAVLRGTVRDKSGAVIPSASVLIKEQATNWTVSLRTGPVGEFVAPQLPPGNYQVEISLEGFERYDRSDIHLETGQTLVLTAVLQVGNLTQTISVTEENPLIDLSKTVTGGSLVSRELELIPLNGRDPLDLVFLFPGVTEQPFDTRDAARPADGHFLSDTPLEAGVFSLSGGRAFSNNLTLDGFDNNDDREARERISYPREAVEEVQVITNQFSAEYGRASGGRVNLRTRSGSNKLHGAGYLFFQDESLNANSFFRNAVGEPRAPYQQRAEGFLLSGPLRTDKLFFAAAYEHSGTPDTAEINIPLPLQTNPRFPLPQPNSGVGSVIYKPAGGTPILGGWFIDEASTPAHRDFLMGRIDAVIHEKHNLSARYDFSHGSSMTSFTGGSRFPSTAVARGRDSQSWAVTENFVVRADIINQFRYQYSRLVPTNLENAETQPVAVVVNGSAGFSAGGSASTFTSNRRGQRRETRNQVSDNFTMVHGRSTLKWGMDVQRVRSHDFDLFEFNGIYTFSNIADFLNNQPSRFEQAVGNPEGVVSNTVYGIYLQQDFRIRPNFSLNFGGRYDLETALSHDANNWSPRLSFSWDPFRSGKTVLRGGFGVFYNRVLLRTFGDYAGKSGLRFVDLRTPDDVLKLFPTLSSSQAANYLSNLFPHILPNTPEITAVASPASNTRRVSPVLRIPYSEQASLGLERELGSGVLVTATYQFNRGVKLWRDRNINAPVPPPGGLLNFLLGHTFSLAMDATTYSNVRFDLGKNSSVPAPNGRVISTPLVLGLNAPTVLSASSTARLSRLVYEAVRPLRPFPDLPGIDQLESSGSSTYNGLTISISKRTGRNSSIHGSYTLSKAFEDTFINTATPQDEFNLAAERSLANTDQRHRFIFQGAFEIPFIKLTAVPVLTLASGRPFTIGNGGNDRNLSDRATDRPNLIRLLPERLTLTDRPGIPSLIDPDLYFALATIGSSGNLGRNVGLGPAQRKIDLAVSRRIQIKEGMSLRPQIEVYNVFNNVVFFVNGFVDITDSDFLQPRAARKARTIQLSMRLDF